MNRLSGEYAQGIEVEHRLIKHLQDVGVNVTPSSDVENKILDIDCYVDGVPTSIKTQHACLKTGNLVFELTVTHQSGEVADSWYKVGQAQQYFFVVGTQLYKANKYEISYYVLRNYWDSIRTLSATTRKKQNDIGHSHKNVQIGLLSLHNLILARIVNWVAELPEEVAYPKL